MVTRTSWKYFAPSILLLPPTLLAVLHLPSPPPFSPQQIIYAHSINPLLLSPILTPPYGFGPTVARVIQGGLLTSLPPNALPLAYCFYLAAAAVRTFVGFLLTRAIGWTHPDLFQHYALYESSAGLGCGLVVYAIVYGVGTSSWLGYNRWRAWRGKGRTGERRDLMAFICLVGLLCALDGTPWTYATALLPALAISGILSISRLFRSPRGDLEEAFEVLSPLSLHSPSQHGPESGPHPPTLSRTFITAFIAFLTFILPPLLLQLNTPHYPILSLVHALEWRGSANRPLLDILILTYPRPGDQGTEALSSTASILERTISSYRPLLWKSWQYEARNADPYGANRGTRPPLITMTVYTHAPASHPHPQFKLAAASPSLTTHTSLSAFPGNGTGTDPNAPMAYYAEGKSPSAFVTFYADADEAAHSAAGETQGQFLHTAEALRYAFHGDASAAEFATDSLTRENEGRGAEWVMLVEDDFPLCGDWGVEGMMNVMQRLRDLHSYDSDTENWRGGFVGTGGSGLIIHRTLLPTLSALLRQYARPPAGNAVATPPPFPPDVLIQMCLLGRIPACREPHAPSSSSSAPPFEVTLTPPSSPWSLSTWLRPLPLHSALSISPSSSPAVQRPRVDTVISSRLLMGHIGGAASTDPHRAYDTDKWACGWRHPFHGWEEVDVVPV